jgi:branched-chain amino acid transport system permease protein
MDMTIQSLSAHALRGRLGWQRGVLAALVCVALGFPLAMQLVDQPFYTGLATRVLIFAIIVSSLNLILGFGGMVSLGHAAFMGAGAYTVGILSTEATGKIGLLPGTESAWVAWPAAALVGGVLAACIGALSLRTRGIYFIMITLAFAQMVYYLCVSLKMYGGDDGLNLTQRSRIGGGIDLAQDQHFYYVVLALLAATLFAMHRLVHSRFGRVIEGIRENETRMQAIGYATTRYKLLCFTLAGAVAGLGGALLANQNLFVSPNMLSWLQSGSLLMMLITGGVGTLWGGPVGALVFLVLEEVLAGYTKHWQMVMGAALIGIVLFAPRGIVGAFRRQGDQDGHA